jgi:hypothetical protein
MNFGIFDFIFLAIVLFQAEDPRPVRVRASAAGGPSR